MFRNKKYSIYNFSVIKKSRGDGTSQCYICEYNAILEAYIEVFSKAPVSLENCLSIEPLTKYYSILARRNYQTGKPLMVTLKDLLIKYNEINYVNYNLEADPNIIKEVLEDHGIYEDSQMFKIRKKNLSK